MSVHKLPGIVKAEVRKSDLDMALAYMRLARDDGWQVIHRSVTTPYFTATRTFGDTTYEIAVRVVDGVTSAWRSESAAAISAPALAQWLGGRW